MMECKHPSMQTRVVMPVLWKAVRDTGPAESLEVKTEDSDITSFYQSSSLVSSALSL